MAFNPFGTGQKKIWMSGLLLVCMIVFVFCTGQINDMEQWLRRLTRGTGATVVTVAHENLSSYDLGQVRDERQAVNDFMRRLCQVTIDNLNMLMQKEQEKPVPTDKKELEKYKARRTEMQRAKFVLIDRLQKPRYFEGGVKFDDLVEFKLWQAQADKLGINLIDAEVDGLLRMEFFSPGYQYLHPKHIEQAWYDAHRNKDINDRQMRRAVTAEFRARLARLAMIELLPGKVFAPDAGLPIPEPGRRAEQRLPVSLSTLWDVYKDKRSEFDVSLIPVRVADFTKEVAKTGAPDQAELQKLFDKYKTAAYDPASPLPSFQTPPEVKVEFLVADPTSPLYQGTAQAKLLLDRTLPLIGGPLDGPLVTASRYGAFLAGRDLELEDRVLAGIAAKKYDDFGAADQGALHFIWPLAAYLAERDPQAVASLVGNVTGVLGDPSFGGPAAWAGFLAQPTAKNPNLIEAAIGIESKRRTLPAALTAVAGATGQPLDMFIAALVDLKWWAGPVFPGAPAEARHQYARVQTNARLVLPLPIIEPQLEKVVIDRMTEQWASRNLMAMKRLLDNNLKPEAVKRLVADFAPQYHLTRVETKQFYSRYNIDQAPALKPLREAYERYYREINWFEKRDLSPERLLKEGDFYKLFFENESFASTTKYQVRPWPPDIHPNQMQVIGLPGDFTVEQPNVAPDVLADVQRHMQHGANQSFRLLDKAQRPMLFWRSDDKPQEFPKQVADARPVLIRAWEKEQARDLALPLAKKIADELARNEDFAPTLLDALAAQAHQTRIVLKDIAPWVPRLVGDQFRGGHRDYIAYQLPKDTIPYPRKDMTKDLLNLYDLKAPLQVSLNLSTGEPTFVKQLNDTNKLLFDAVKRAYPKAPQGHFVQVITNEPMDIYYVAVVTRRPQANNFDFRGDVLRYASESQRQPFVDSFVTRAQEQLAMNFRTAFVEQLKENLGYNLVDQNVVKNFEKED